MDEEKALTKAQRLLNERLLARRAAMSPEAIQEAVRRAQAVGKRPAPKSWEKPESTIKADQRGPLRVLSEAELRPRVTRGQPLAPRSYTGKQRAFKPFAATEVESARITPKGSKAISFTPRKLHEKPGRSGDAYGEGASSSEQDVHTSVMDELKKEISGHASDRQAQQAFLKKRGAPSVEAFRAGLPSEEEPQFTKDELLENPLTPEEWKEENAYAPHPEQVKEYLRSNRPNPTAAEKMREFIKSNPFLTGPHIKESLRSKAFGDTEKSNNTPFQSVPFPEDVSAGPDESPLDLGSDESEEAAARTAISSDRNPLEDERDIRADNRARTGFGMSAPSRMIPGAIAPVHDEKTSEKVLRGYVAPSRVAPERTPLLSTKLASPSSKRAVESKIEQLKKFSLDTPELVENLKRGIKGIKVRRYTAGGKEPTQKNIAKSPPKKQSSPLGRMGGTETRFSALERLKEATPEQRKLPKILLAEQLSKHMDYPGESSIESAKTALTKNPEKKAKAIEEARARGKARHG